MKFSFLTLLSLFFVSASFCQKPAISGEKINIATFGIETINIDNVEIGDRVERAIDAAFTSCDRYNVRYNIPYRKNKGMTPGTISAKDVEIQQMIIDLYINRKKLSDTRKISDFAKENQIQNIVIGRLVYDQNKRPEESYELLVYYIDLDQQVIIGEPFYKLIGKEEITSYDYIKGKFTEHLQKTHLCVADYSKQIDDLAVAKQKEQFMDDLKLLIKLEYLFPGDEDVARELIEIKKSSRNGILLYLKYKFYFYQVKVTESLKELNKCIRRELEAHPDEPDAWQEPCKSERDRAIKMLDAILDILYEIRPLIKNPATLETIDEFIEGYSQTKNEILKP